MKKPDELKKKNIIPKYRELFLYPRDGFPKQPRNPRGRDGKGRFAELGGEAAASRSDCLGFNPGSPSQLCGLWQVS